MYNAARAASAVPITNVTSEMTIAASCIGSPSPAASRLSRLCGSTFFGNRVYWSVTCRADGPDITGGQRFSRRFPSYGGSHVGAPPPRRGGALRRRAPTDPLSKVE
ncbi:hypothetical protein GCM10010519_32470 [Streptomyces lactacystinicus]